MATQNITEYNNSRKGLSVDYIKSVLDYDPLTGIFRWRERMDVRPTTRARLTGKIAGSLDKQGYIRIVVVKNWLMAHRLAWLYMTGKWPEFEIDHRNGVRSDNRWAELRAATNIQNAVNSKKRCDNTSGFKGVSWSERNKKWISRITADKKPIYLGCFETAEAAYEAYKQAAINFHGEFVRFE